VMRIRATPSESVWHVTRGSSSALEIEPISCLRHCT
jgi:hypothetical protein